MNMLEEVFITGMGAYSSAGSNLPALWQHTLHGDVSATMEKFSSSRTEKIFPLYRAPLPHFQTPEKALLRSADRTAHFALAAALEAWSHAALEEKSVSKNRCGVIVGSARGPASLQEKEICSFTSTEASYQIKPSSSLYSSFSSLAGLLARVFNLQGPAFMVSSSCTSAATALHTALGMIRSGVLDLVLVGGVDAPLTKNLLEQYQQTGILATASSAKEALAPFDRDRCGTVLGEGAAFLVLESKTSLLQRGASPLGCLESIVLACEPRYRTRFDQQGLALRRVLDHSLRQARLLPQDIGLIHLHGTGTRFNDLIESRAIHACFGPLHQQPYACATKAITGHTLGAAALFQVVLTLCALGDGVIPPTTNCRNLDPACTLRLEVSDDPLIDRALCLTAGFWGVISSLILSRVKE